MAKNQREYSKNFLHPLAKRKLEFKIEPWEHQYKVIRHCLNVDEYALFWEVGTGKTGAMINILRAKFLQYGRYMDTIVFCPLIVVENWYREFQEHSNLTNVLRVSGTGSQRCNIIKTGKRGYKAVILIVNYEALRSKAVFQELRTFKPEIIVCDESHRLKKPTTLTARRVQAIADMTKLRFLMTGTPITNTAEDLFSQFRILDKGQTFGRVFQAFRNRYFYDVNGERRGLLGYFPDWKPDPDTYGELHKKVKEKASIVRKADCLDLPPLIKKKVFVDMEPEQSRVYKEVRNDFVSYCEGKTVVATMAMTKALRLMQVVSGYVMGESEGPDGTIIQDEITWTVNPKAIALRDLLEQITVDSKCLVWAVFKQNYRTIRAVCEALRISFVELHGEVAAKDKQAAIDQFNQDPRCKVLIGHPGSGGIGINLVSASYTIFFSRSFSLEHDIQAEARNYRPGAEQHDKITRIDLLCKGTIDEVVYEKLIQKQRISDAILTKEVVLEI